MTIVTTITSLLGLVVTIAGLAIAAMHVGKVKGAGLLLAGFALQAFAALIFRLASFAISSSAGSSLLPAYGIGSVVSLAGGVMLVAGVYSVLTNAARASHG
jgi:hypothetical protein